MFRQFSRVSVSIVSRLAKHEFSASRCLSSVPQSNVLNLKFSVNSVNQYRFSSDKQSPKNIEELILNLYDEIDSKEKTIDPDALKDLGLDSFGPDDIVMMMGKALAEIREFKNKYHRALAETENVRKRGQRQVEDAKVFAVQSFCKDLLEVADTLDLAINAVKPEVIQKNPEVKGLYDGVVMMKTVLLKTFEKHGLKPVAPEGEKFDPNLHDAIFQIPKEQAKFEPGYVGHVMKIGYSLHGRPIRAAQVGVVQN